MTVAKPTETAKVPLSRLALNLARYYLGNRWVLLALGAAVLLAGIGLNWSWLVAVGLAPILISVLPCLVMCALGVCMLCRSSEKQSTAARDATDAATSPPAPAVAKIDGSSATGSNCCQEGGGETPPSQGDKLNRSRKGESPMRKFTATFLLASTLLAGAMAAPSLYAQSSQQRSGSMMDHGMMGDQKGMMGMMKQMSEMMDHCNSMMGDRRPNDQWRRNAPSAPDKRG
jgi:hypothetical protein